jgi:uncharacterized SAM-binding protein YcdF (DUF218 family)
MKRMRMQSNFSLQNAIEVQATILFEYMKYDKPAEKADIIFVGGSSDISPVYHAVNLFKQGRAPKIMFSGNTGHKKLIPGADAVPEAIRYRDLATTLGVPEDVIIIETESTNTGDNILFSKKILKELDLDIQTTILVHKPYMERRFYATASKQWPEADHFIFSQKEITFADYVRIYPDKEKFIQTLVGDVVKMKAYVDAGFQIAQEIPEEVQIATQALTDAGYTKYLPMA